jgi:hypothetical protein
MGLLNFTAMNVIIMGMEESTMSAAAGEQGYNDTAATSDPIIYPWRPTDDTQIHGGHGIIWGAPDPPPEKPKRKSKWLLKQMARRGHKTV